MGKQIFISHAWGNDSNNRDNHLRSKIIADKLILKGYTVWFDAYDIFGNIDSAIMNGINNADIILICLSEKYFEKINNAVNTNKVNDNCYKEWNFSMFKQKKIIPIIMDDLSVDLFLNKDGIIQMYLSSSMFINFSKNFNDEYNLLLRTLKKFNVFTKKEKKFFNIKSNSSLDNLVNLFDNKIKCTSPKKKILNLQKTKSFYLQNLRNEFLKLNNKNISKFKEIIFI